MKFLLKNFTVFLILFVCFSSTNGQEITNVTISSPALCDDDVECIDIIFNGLDLNLEYSIEFYRYIGATLVTSPPISNFTSTNDFDVVSNSYEHCFEVFGDYVIELSSEEQVLDSYDYEVLPYPDPLIIFPTVTPVTCHAGSDGSFTATIYGGLPPYTYTLNGNGETYNGVLQTNQDQLEIDNLSQGLYTLTIEYNGACEENYTFNIDEPVELTATISTTPETCFNAGDAELTVNAIGGNPGGYSYEWSTTETTQSITVVPGEYAVTVFDSKNCTTTNSTTVDPATDIDFTIDATPPLCHDGLGSATIIPSGGTPPYTYEWPADGTTNQTNNNLSAGTILFKIEDDNGCSKSSFFLLNEPDPVLTTINSVVPVSCSGDTDGEVDLSISGGTSDYTISFFQGVNNVGTFPNLPEDESLIFSGFTEDNYSISITDANGCPGDQTPFVIDGPDPIVLDETINNVSCFGENTGSITVLASGGSGNFTYTWTDEIGNSIVSNSTNTITDLYAGTYILEVNDGSCVELISYTITEEEKIELFNTQTTPVSCNGQNDGSISNTFITGGVGNFSLVWYNSSGFNYLSNDMSEPINNLVASDYTLKVLDGNGCFVDSLTTVTISEPAPISLSQVVNNNPTCYNFSDGIIKVLADGGTPFNNLTLYNYSLLHVETGSVYDNDANELTSGTYELSVTDLNNCSFDTTFNLVNPSEIDFNVQEVDLTCFESNDGALIYNYTNITNPQISYYNVQNLNNVQYVIDSAISLPAGVYNSTIIDDNQCEKTIETTINQPDPLSYNVTTDIPNCFPGQGNNILTSNGELSFDFFGGIPDYQLVFNADTFSPNFGVIFPVDNLVSGNYDFILIDDNGCELSFSETVGSASEIEVFESITNVTTFGGNNGEIDITVDGGQGPYEYQWSSTNFASTDQDIENLEAGNYSVEVVDQNDCSVIFQYSVIDPSCIDPVTGENIITFTPLVNSPQCPDDEAVINFSLTGGLAPYHCILMGDIDSDGIVDVILDDNNVVSTLDLPITVPASGNYTLEVTDAFGCVISYNFDEEVTHIAPISITPQIVDASCPGFNDGQIIINPDTDIFGGTGPYTDNNILWQGVDLNPVNPNALSTGEYVVTITDNNNCPESFYYFVGEPEPITLLDTTLIHPQCVPGINTPGSNGQIVLVPQGGVTNQTGYQYDWGSNVPSVQNPDNLSAGVYQVYVADLNCTSELFTITLNSPEIISYVTHNIDPITCYNQCDGSISVTTENSPNEVVSWYNDQGEFIAGSNVASNLCEGFYSFKIQNEFNCIVTSQSELDIGELSLTNPSEFSIEITHSLTVPPNNICNGVASVTSSTGTPPFEYVWSDDNAQTTQTAVNLCGNQTYSVTVTDANGCESSDYFSIDVEGCNFEIGTTTVNQPECFDDFEDGEITIDNFSGGIPPYTVYVYNDNLLFSEQTTNADFITIQNLPEGNYNISIESSDECKDLTNAQIILPDPFSYSYNIENDICYTSFAPEAHITIIGGTPFESGSPYSLDFFGFEGYFAYSENGIEEYIAGNSLSGGTSYPLVVTDANGCTSPDNSIEDMFTITVDPINPIIVNIDALPVQCADGNNTGFASASVTGGLLPYEFNWYEVGELAPLNGNNTTLNTIDQLAQGDYYLSVKDFTGCETITFFSITEPDEVVVYDLITPPSCPGVNDGSITIDSITGGNGGFQYLWSPTGNITSDIFSLSAGVEYVLSIIEQEQGCVYTDTFELQDPEEVSITINSTDESCNNYDDGQLAAAFSIPLTDISSIQWFANGLPISSFDGGESPTIINLASGIYDIEVVNTSGCSYSAVDTIYEPDPIELTSVTTNPSCFGYSDGEISLSSVGGVGSYTYEIFDAANVLVDNSPNPTNLLEGTYTVTITDDNDCVLSESIVLTEPNEIILNLEYSPVTCHNGNDGSATFNPINNQGISEINWSNVQSLNDYVTIVSNTDSIDSIEPGNYILQFEDENGCKQEEFFTLTQPDPIEVNIIIVPSSCSNENGATAFVQSNGTSPVDYLWSINQGQEQITTNGSSVSELIAGEEVKVNGFDANGCPVPLTTETVPPSPNPLIQVNINQTEENLCFGDSLADLEVIMYNDDNSFIQGNITYQWYIDGSLIPASDGGVFNSLTNLGPGEYVVVVTEDNYDCSNSDTIVIDEIDPFTVHVSEVNSVDCFGFSTGEVNTETFNGTSPFEYSWNNDMGVDIATDISNPTNLVAGTYNLEVSDANGCTYLESFEISQNDSISLQSSSIPADCFGESNGQILTNVTGGVGPYSYVWENEIGQTVSLDPSPFGLNSQLYYLTITDALNCSFNDTIFVNQPAEIEIVEEITDVVCFGDNTGSISLSLSGGTGSYDYFWEDNFPNNNIIFNLEAGTYNVDILDANNCLTEATFSVMQEDSIVVENIGTFQSCSEGAAEVVILSGGIPPYEVYWLDDPIENNNTQILTNLPLGSYSYYIQDANGCLYTDSVVISGTNEIETDILESTNISCNGDNSGSINIIINNANAFPYNYSINDLNFDEDNFVFDPNFIISNLEAGSYTIYIQDSEECIDTIETVILSEPEALSLSSSVTDVICFGESNGTISLDINGGVGAYDIALDDVSNTIISNSNGLDTLSLSVGTYSLFVTDENDCILSDGFTINQPEQLEFSISNSSNYNGFNVSCLNSNDGFFNVNINGGTGEYTLNLNDSTFGVENGFLIENLSSGDYFLSVSDTNNCTSELNTVLDAPEPLNYSYTDVSDYNGFNTTCYALNDGFINTQVTGGVEPYDFSSDGGLTFELSNSIFNNYTFNNLSENEYVFVVKDQNDCLASFDYSIMSPGEIVPTLDSIVHVSCFGDNLGSAFVGVNGGAPNFTFILENSFGGVQTLTSDENTVMFDTLNAGLYSLTVTDINGCTNSSSNTLLFTLDEGQIISYSVEVNNPSCNTSSNGSITISNIEGGTEPYTLKFYSAAAGVNEQVDNLNSSLLIPITNLASATYTMQIFDDNGCEVQEQIIVEEPLVLEVEVESIDVSCFESNDGLVSVSVSGGTAPYNISFNDQQYSTDDSYTFNNLEDTTYTIMVVDELGCEGFSEAIINQPSEISIDYTKVDNLCYNQSYGSLLFQVSGGSTPYQYELTTPSGFIVSETNTISNLFADDYLFTVTDANNCIDTQMVSITEPDEIIIENEVYNVSCPGESDGSIFTTISNFQQSYEIFWQSESLSGSINNNLSVGEYIITVVDNFGCFNVDTVNIVASNALLVELNVTEPECSYINNGQVQLLFDGQQDYQSALLSTSYSEQMTGNMEHLFNEVGVGEYNLSIIYNSTCQFDTSFSISTIDDYDCIIPYPSFSPNFDGVNDAFMPIQYFGMTAELIVFNRWGEKVFYEKSINPAWDGTNFNGDALPSADYYYIIKFDNSSYNDITGIITLLK